MSLAFTIRDQDGIGPMLDRLEAAIGNPRSIHLFIAPRVESVTRDYLIIQARNRHKTAQRLGGQPTGHLSRAAESVTSRATEQEATVGITSPGIARAVRDIAITPKAGKKYLTIPAVGSVYGKRAREQRGLVFMKFRKGSAALVEGEPYTVQRGPNKGQRKTRPLIGLNGKPMVVYWLVKGVLQKQDRTLLPSDELFTEAAKQGIKDLLDVIDRQSPEGGAA
jgi:hypothetical protein